MIKIVERQTVKLPGLTSLFVSFDYNKLIVDELKLLGNTFYNADTKEWEVPLTCLADLVDRTCKIDSISIYPAASSAEGCAGDVILHPDTYKTQPFDYQLEGIKQGLKQDSWLLLDAPGLGKSLQLMYLAQELKQRDNIKHCLVVCGINTLKTNWKAEIEKHSNLTCTILGQRINRNGKLVIDGVDKRVAQLMNPIDEFFVIVNVESLRDDRIIKGILNGPNKFDMIVFDEIHTCFEYDTLIQTDSGLLKIGDIVTHNIDCCVYSYNHKKQLYEYKPIISRFEHTAVQLLQLTFEEGESTYILQCTPDHPIFTKNRGYVPASELTPEDEFLLNNIV